MQWHLQKRRLSREMVVEELNFFLSVYVQQKIKV